MEPLKRLVLRDYSPRRAVPVGDVVIGGNALPVVQSMTNTDTQDVAATLAQITQAAIAGARIMRVAVPHAAALPSLQQIVMHSPVPIVADIHFDYRLALGAMAAGVDKIRINPGNIGGEDRIRAVVTEAAARKISIRVGVNAGSLEPDVLKRFGSPCAEALVESALRNVSILENYGFNAIVVSMKGSDVPITVEAYRQIVERCDYPLHIGITESGTRWTGAIRSSVGLGVLLAYGIGDTLRVSLAADPVEEIRVAYRILEALGIQKRGPTVIACPTCGRTKIDVIALAEAAEKALENRTEPFTVAVMGCAVNGPGEAREADIGVAGGDGEGLLFKKGKIVRKVQESRLLEELLELFDLVADELRCKRNE